MSASFRNYYETLGVAKTATADDIKKAFRKLARQHHPDLAKDKKAAEEKFKEINEAYEVLGNPENRKKYDTYGANWSQAAAGGRTSGRRGGGMPSGFGGMNGFGGFENMGGFERDGEAFHFGGTGYSDFFEQFFGTRRGGERSSSFGGAPQRGSDIEADLLVTLEEVLHGATRQVSFRKAGKLQTYTVKIPQGVHEGQRIRLSGQGTAGAHQGASGDLYLCIKLQQHPDFYFEKSDVYHDLEIPAWQAVLGGELTIPVPEGRVKLKIPAGTENGKKFRIPGKGLPEKNGERGDFFAVVTIVIPTELSPEKKAAWEQLRFLDQKTSSV